MVSCWGQSWRSRIFDLLEGYGAMARGMLKEFEWQTKFNMIRLVFKPSTLITKFIEKILSLNSAKHSRKENETSNNPFLKLRYLLQKILSTSSTQKPSLSPFPSMGDCLQIKSEGGTAKNAQKLVKEKKLNGSGALVWWTKIATANVHFGRNKL